MRYVTPGLLALTLLWMQSGSAATLTFSNLQPLSEADINGVLSVPQFDPSLGALVGVDWSITGAIASILGIRNDASRAVTGAASVDVDFELSGTGLSLASSPDFSIVASTGSVSLGIGESALFPVTSTFSLTGSEAALAPFVGLGTIDLTYATVLAFGGSGFGSDITISQSTDAGIRFDITYEYAVVPLPGALLLMLTALGGLGGLAWRRRA